MCQCPHSTEGGRSVCQDPSKHKALEDWAWPYGDRTLDPEMSVASSACRTVPTKRFTR